MLRITTEFRKGILFVRLKGVLNKNTTDKFNKKVTNLIESNGIRNIVFNLSELKFIDIRGINTILHNYELCKKNNGRSFLCGNNINIDKRLRSSRLINYVYEITDELSAIKLLKGW